MSGNIPNFFWEMHTAPKWAIFSQSLAISLEYFVLDNSSKDNEVAQANNYTADGGDLGRWWGPEHLYFSGFAWMIFMEFYKMLFRVYSKTFLSVIVVPTWVVPFQKVFKMCLLFVWFFFILARFWLPVNLF